MRKFVRKSVAIFMVLIMVVALSTPTTADAKTLSTPKITKVSNEIDGVKVQWKKVPKAAKYRVLRKTGSGSWKKVADTKNTTYLDTKVKSGKKYTYTIRCISSNGKSYTSGYNKKGRSVERLDAGKITTLTNKAAGITIKWTKVQGAKGYYLCRKTGNGSYKTIADITNTKTSYTDASVKNKCTYVYTVRPYNNTSVGKYIPKSIQYDNNGHIHNYNNYHPEKGYWETVTVEDAWDEDVYETHNVCNQCGLDTGKGPKAVNNILIHLAFDDTLCDNYSVIPVKINTIHHEAITERVYHKTADAYYSCDCGAKK